MSGTAIVYGNGSADDAMASFPPEAEVLQDSFLAVFTGPDSDVQLTPEQQDEAAKAALRNEVALHVCRSEYEEQAKQLRTTNWVYAKLPASAYKQHLVDKLPSTSSVPSCFEACAQFVPLRSNEVDSTRASGPSNATTGADQEVEGLENDALEVDQWSSLFLDLPQQKAEFPSAGRNSSLDPGLLSTSLQALSQ